MDWNTESDGLEYSDSAGKRNFALLWGEFHEESAFALYSPFFVCLAAGNLDSQCLGHFLSQELQILKAIVEARELTVTDNESAKIWKSVLETIQSHENFVRDMGYGIPSEIILEEATSKYTEFVLALTSGEVEVEGVVCKFKNRITYTLAAIAAYMRLCAYLVDEMNTVLDPNCDIVYRKWFESGVYKNSVLAVEGAMDFFKHCASLTDDPEFELAGKIYHHALKLSTKIFVAPLISQQSVVPFLRVHKQLHEGRLTLFHEFIETCLYNDSFSILTLLRILTLNKACLDEFEEVRSKIDTLATEREDRIGQICSNAVAKTEFHYEDLKLTLEQIGEVEKKFNAGIEELGALRGIRVDEIEDISRDLWLHNGCTFFLQQILRIENVNTAVHVLSEILSGDVIRFAFAEANLERLICVHSNQLAMNNFVTTGQVVKKLETATEKLAAFNEILNDQRKNEEHSKEELTVYIGGTTSDLLCLLEADIGIIILGLHLNITEVGHHFGVKFVPLFSALVRKQKEVNSDDGWKSLCNEKGTLYTVSSWCEVHAFFLGM